MGVLPLFWPPEHTHRILPVVLSREGIPSSIRPHLADLDELASLADAIRALQDRSGSFVGGTVARSALERSAALLAVTAESLSGPEAEVIRLRAEELNGDGCSTAAIRQAQIRERDLVLLCGPMATWQRKSSATYHGFVASVPWAPGNALIARADSLPLRDYMADLLDQPRLTARPVPGFLVTTLITCGGEPNGFPKHFAYFLPEDEGVKGAGISKTVVYANVYSARFEGISRPLAQLGLEPTVDVSPEQALKLLVLWFRGHDIGHQLRLPTTAFRELRLLGRATSIALQEALADVIGYLAMTGGPWCGAFGGDLAACEFVFLAELLRYLERGSRYFPDSEAADLELSYLLAGGYAELGPTGRLVWEPGRLNEGMVALGRELTTCILGTDVLRAEQLVAAHLGDYREPMASWRSGFRRSASGVPTSLAYHFTEPLTEPPITPDGGDPNDHSRTRGATADGRAS
jgi:hypothetical protein